MGKFKLGAYVIVESDTYEAAESLVDTAMDAMEGAGLHVVEQDEAVTRDDGSEEFGAGWSVEPLDEDAERLMPEGGGAPS